MAQSRAQAPNMDQFEVYFRRADLDQDGRISGNEAVSFFQATNLPRPVLAHIWTIADQNRTGFLGRQQFYNALKLVTVAQSGRELTPEIVRAALYSAASAQIPPPRIDLTPTPRPQENMTVGSSIPPTNAASLLQTISLTSQQSQVMRPPRPPLPSATFQFSQGVNGPQMPQYEGAMAVSQPPNSSALFDGNTVVSHGGTASQPIRSVGSIGQDGLSMTSSGLPSSASAQPGAQVTLVSTQPALPKPSDTAFDSKVEAKDSKALTLVGNGHTSDSLFGDVFSATAVQAKQDSSDVTSGVTSSSISYAPVPTSSGLQPALKSRPLESSEQITTANRSMDGQHQQGQLPASIAASRPMDSQHQQGQLPVKLNQQFSVQASSGPSTGATNSFTVQSQVAWPKMTQSDIQKYSRVFMQVDNDRDGKITGEQARNLFLSWRQPREVLKQVWDLSDQDKDSMLSLKEFCIALYLMERYREGHPLPPELPRSIMYDETLLSVFSQPVAPHENAAWRAASARQQSQAMRGAQPSASLGKPPRQIPVPQLEYAMQSSQLQKPKVPVLEKHLLDQLSSEEQTSLNSKFQEAFNAEKKVAELEKEILDAREKIQFYHSKMQELILYKSRCDNRLNEIIERVSADKREVEALGKKYEEKYTRVGDVASKLTIEEATFRDIQDKKMELYRAIVKLEQHGGADIEERANLMQLDLEELVKAVNERCKTYGVRAKPTSLVELPYGWQPGIQGGSADWDGKFDVFEDEGFVIVKELTLDVQNVIAPPKTKSSLRDVESSKDENKDAQSISDADEKSEHVQRISEDDRVNAYREETASSLPESPARSNAIETEDKEFEDSHSKKDISFDGSPHANQSEHGGHESTFRRGFDEPSWGTFDSQYDTDGALDFNHLKKDVDSERQIENSLFGSDDWGLHPIRTSSLRTDNMYSKQSPFFDSVPSTPGHNMSSSPLAENMFQRNSAFGFADSVPSTPMYSSSNSPRRFSEGVEERSFDNSFSRFGSFDMQDGGLFTPREPMTFARFDSMRSPRDSEYDPGLSSTRESFARFDSFRSMADSDYNFSLFPPHEPLTRFDSTHSTSHSDFGHRFSSFDDADPFGSNDPFKTSLESKTPRRESDSWNDHLKVSLDSQTPRKDSDIWNDPFNKSYESQTPKRDSGSWNAF